MKIIIRPSRNFKEGLIEGVQTLFFVLLFVILIRYFIGEIRWIPSGSMRPTLIEGDRVFVERVSRFFEEPKRGQVWVFYPPFEELSNKPWPLFKRLTGLWCKDIAYIKRIIGMPGDKFLIRHSKDDKYSIIINGEELKEPYIMDDYDYIPCRTGMICGPFTVPEGHYFMMGDNRGNSQDSRFWGFLPKERLIGQAVVMFWPVTRIKKLNHNY